MPRARLTPEQLEARREQERLRGQARRAAAEAEERERERDRGRARRAAADDEQRERERERDRARRAAQDEEDRERHREQMRAHRASLTPQQSSSDRASNTARRQPLRQQQQARRLQGTIGLAREPLSWPHEHSTGSMVYPCTGCGALHFYSETDKGKPDMYTNCCAKGKVMLDPFGPMPGELRQLFVGQSDREKAFRQHIRQYNNGLAMASMVADLKTPRGGGPYVFTVHGAVYHATGSLHPEVGVPPVCAQVLIMDTAEAAAELAGRPMNKGCDAGVFALLHGMLNREHQYAKAFKNMAEVVKEEEAKASAANTPRNTKVSMVFKYDKKDDQRRYNAASADEIAVVYVGDDDDIPGERAFVIYERGKRLQKLHYQDKRLDAFTYPLLYPTGKDGWQRHLKLQNTGPERKYDTLTMKKYYAFLLFSRMNTFNPLLYAGKLMQQYVVDVFLRAEQNDLQYHKDNQAQLRVDNLRGLDDYVQDQAAAGNPGGPAPGRIILGSTFRGGRRYMSAKYHDTVSITCKHGQSDLFLTFTCNPNWTDIKDNLAPGQTASDRPDLVARVFQEKCAALLEDVIKKGVLGQVKAWVWVIEYQKRGLPHMHMLLTLTDAWKIRNPDQVDSLISAELPDKDTDPILYNIISGCMVHRECGPTNPLSPCMKDGKCSKRFPKSFRDTTALNEDGYPEYRRRDDGRFMDVPSKSVQGATFRIDNRRVVPYSPWLSRKYNAHINLEVSGCIYAAKYLYKYVYKGPDRAKLQLGDDQIDEIQEYRDMRYISPPEAAYRLLGGSMDKQSDSVDRLQVHLPGDQTVMFKKGQHLQALADGRDRVTSLLAYFEKNKECADHEAATGSAPTPDSRTIHYHEFPEHFVYKKDDAAGKYVWATRKRGGERKIGRIFFVSPAQGERFALRLLLLYGKGFQSYEDCKTVNGVLHATFAEAARAAGYLRDDECFKRAMEEASGMQMPAALRGFFVSLIGFATLDRQATDELWLKYKQVLSEDFLHRHGRQDLAESLAFYDIVRRLETLGKRQGDHFTIVVPRLDPDNIEPDYEMHKQIGEQHYAQLNPQQKAVVDQVLQSVEAQNGQGHFIDGPGGSGKTFVYNTIYHLTTAKKKDVLCVAWTGIAANLLPGGRTAASAFQLTVDDGCRTSSMTTNSKKGRALAKVDIIIWDEAAMAPKCALEATDCLLRDLMDKPNVPFGGKIVLLGGDFRQVLPVVERGTRYDEVQATVKKSHLWPDLLQHKLTTNMRVQGADDGFRDFLLRIGDGVDVDNGDMEIPADFLPTADLAEAVFGDAFRGAAIDLSDRAILTPLNSNALAINNQILDRIPGIATRMLSQDELEAEAPSDAFNLPTEFLNQMMPAALPPHQLNLKVGCIVMLLRNLSVTDGLCNGTRLIVRHIGRRVLQCEHINGAHQGEPVLIPKIDCYYRHENKFRIRRRQFPVRLSFALTINKAQGQSFGHIGISLESRIFGHGQLYVALSRARSRAGVNVQSPDGMMQNIVYKEVLS